MTSAPPLSRTSKLRRTGRHQRPSQVQRAAQRAGKAAPAVAALGALAAAPQALSFTPAVSPGPAAAATRAVTAHLDAAVRPARRAARSSRALASRTYTVRTGDTLSGIAERFYGNASDWPWLYHINSAKISDPNLIYTGEVLSVPVGRPGPAGYVTYRPRHARGVITSSHTAAAGGGHGGEVSCRGGGAGMLPENYPQIVGFLTAHGYSGLAAAGIAGNIYQESEGNPESAGDGGGGLIGWTPLPAGFVTGNPAADLQTQLAALLAYNQQWAQYLPALNAAPSAAAAAAIYMTDFERPGDPAAATREAAATAVARACGL